jgi:hypothetical protein
MSCGGRANILQRPPKDMKLLAFGVVLQDAAIAFSKCKDTKKSAKMQEKTYLFSDEFHTKVTLVRTVRDRCILLSNGSNRRRSCP